MNALASIRSATRDDTVAINAVRDQTWAASYRGIITDARLDAIASEDRPPREPWWLDQEGCHAFVAERAGVVVGCAVCGPVRETHRHYTGETYILYVVPDHQRQGIGQQLLGACAKALVDDNHRSMIAWTFDKGFATRFYENMNGIKVGNKKSEVAGESHELAGFGWDDLEKLAR